MLLANTSRCGLGLLARGGSSLPSVARPAVVPGLSSVLLQATAPAPLSRSIHTPPALPPHLRPGHGRQQPIAISISADSRISHQHERKSEQQDATRSVVIGGSMLAILGVWAWERQRNSPSVSCDSARPYVQAAADAANPNGPPPESIVDLYQLSFGTACGVCAGIFIKKGLKLIAVMLGGTYVLMQYFNSQKWITINWKSLGSKYESFIDGAAGGPNSAGDALQKGNRLTNSRAARIWNRLVDFLTADFQQRATFTAGLILGLRIG